MRRGRKLSKAEAKAFLATERGQEWLRRKIDAAEKPGAPRRLGVTASGTYVLRESPPDPLAPKTRLPFEATIVGHPKGPYRVRVHEFGMEFLGYV